MSTPETRPPDLTGFERELLAAGCLEMYGPATPSHEMAVAMGFKGTDDLDAECLRIHDAIRRGDLVSLTPLDWTRALVVTEVCFGSDVFGAGVEWTLVSGYSDEETIHLLRSMQRKLVEPWRVEIPPPDSR